MGLSYEELARWFGQANVVRVPSAMLATFPLPEDTKATLRGLGLPTFVGVGDFPCFTSVVTIDERYRAEFQRPGQSSKLFRLGTSAGVPTLALCVDEMTGEVIQISLPAAVSSTFVNSSLRAFIECLYAASRHQISFLGENEGQIEQGVRAFREKLHRIDPRAFDSPDNYWPQFVIGLSI